MSDANPNNQTAYQQDAVHYLKKATQLFGGYKKRGFEFLQLAPGLRVLDAGCGTGEDAAAIAQLVGTSGRVDGIDAVDTMIAAAQLRAQQLPGRNLSIQKANIHQLPFDANTFDRTRADRVFQHLDQPEQALAELIRVTKPDGWISILDVDWNTLLVDADDRATSDAIVATIRSFCPSPSAGRRLYRWFKQAALEEVEVYGETVCIHDLPIAVLLCGLEIGAKTAAASGTITEDSAHAWLADLQARHQHGTFFTSITGFIARGRKK